ncbi:hypothetical protein IHE45_10G094800 [Dioscorea alata]|uniref:Uncharacterized protein n=1 Tax=Dioscorea alata TaxID=55571 RepID=A0ACB7VCW5_DIOAL|nr:hypothetical protein IHE45_10G094800 [Dioscorea alata]
MRRERSNDAKKERPKRSVSFNWPGTKMMISSPEQPRQMRRPKTQPDLFSWRTADHAPPPALQHHLRPLKTAKEERLPSKLLVNVTITRSLGAVQVMASTLWTVNDLIAATVELYIKEGRRPLLPTTLLSHFTLHYSQFSLEGLDPNEKLKELGSRTFFLYIKTIAATASCSDQVQNSSKIDERWFNFASFLL